VANADGALERNKGKVHVAEAICGDALRGHGVAFSAAQEHGAPRGHARKGLEPEPRGLAPLLLGSEARVFPARLHGAPERRHAQRRRGQVPLLLGDADDALARRLARVAGPRVRLQHL
jgi:hypothetical protein